MVSAKRRIVYGTLLLFLGVGFALDLGFQWINGTVAWMAEEREPEPTPRISWRQDYRLSTHFEEREISHSFSLYGTQQEVRYGNWIRGSKLPKTRSVSFFDRATVRRGTAQQVLNQLKRAGLMELEGDDYLSGGGRPQEELRIVLPSDPEQRYVLRFYAAARTPQQEKVFSIIERIFHEQVYGQLTEDHYRIFEGDVVDPIEVELVELLNNPKVYHGRRVRTTGFLVWEFEHHALYSDSEGRFGENSIAIGLFSQFAVPDELRLVPDSFVAIEGVFFDSPGGHFNLWPSHIGFITRIDPLDPEA